MMERNKFVLCALLAAASSCMCAVSTALAKATDNTAAVMRSHPGGRVE